MDIKQLEKEYRILKADRDLILKIQHGVLINTKKGIMAKNDKEFGKWKSTIQIPNKLTILRYEFGIIIKEKGKEEERVPYPTGATWKDGCDYLNDYYG